MSRKPVKENYIFEHLCEKVNSTLIVYYLVVYYDFDVVFEKNLWVFQDKPNTIVF